MSLFSDADLQDILVATGEPIRFYQSDATTLVTELIGHFVRPWSSVDGLDTSLRRRPFEFSTDQPFIRARTADLAGVSEGHMVKLTDTGYTHRDGVEERSVFKVVNIEPDGHGISIVSLSTSRNIR